MVINKIILANRISRKEINVVTLFIELKIWIELSAGESQKEVNINNNTCLIFRLDRLGQDFD